MISETKLDASFPTGQFCINGYTSPYRLGRNDKGEGILIYVRKDIPSKLARTYFRGVSMTFFDILLRKKDSAKKSLNFEPFFKNFQSSFSIGAGGCVELFGCVVGSRLKNYTNEIIGQTFPPSHCT